MLQEPDEGGNSCAWSNHDDWRTGVIWEVEWIEDSRKDWNLKIENSSSSYLMDTLESDAHRGEEVSFTNLLSVCLASLTRMEL